MKILLTISLCLLIQACTAPAQKVNYYLLHSAIEAKESAAPDDSKTVVLEKIQLTDYLKQSSLVMQLQQHELYFSRLDLWAEKLDTGIASAMLADLNQASSDMRFIQYTSPQALRSDYRLIVQVEHFLATDTSQAIVSGRYWMVDQKTNQPLLTETFYLNTALELDGYAHAVEKLRELLGNLSKNIQLEMSSSLGQE
jgi:uncharacterized lipoprotein YmbA